MCLKPTHKPITELSPEYREKAREIATMISQRVPLITQTKICDISGADKNKVGRFVGSDLDLIATMITVLGLKVVPEGHVYCSKETGSRYVAQAGVQWLFTGAIPLLISTGVLTCSVSDLGRFTPP